ncbi:MAG: hypothetical protein CMJ49_01725, partial [Planctomycetaceae bacterium]|nr:hypothetical protein [Planctomycetaceae bacterium]
MAGRCAGDPGRRLPRGVVARRAFTLVEVIVVVTILSVATMMIVPQLSGHMAFTQLRESARQLSTAATYARYHAVTTHQVCRLVIDVEKNRFKLVSLAAKDETRPEADDEEADSERSERHERVGPIRA